MDEATRQLIQLRRDIADLKQRTRSLGDTVTSIQTSVEAMFRWSYFDRGVTVAIVAILVLLGWLLSERLEVIRQFMVNSSQPTQSTPTTTP